MGGGSEDVVGWPDESDGMASDAASTFVHVAHASLSCESEGFEFFDRAQVQDSR